MDLNMNNSFWGVRGFIGRRDYLLNLMYLSLINSLLSAPFSIWIATSLQNPFEAFNIPALLASAPIFATFFYGIAIILSLVFGYGLVVRRLSDIFGVEHCVKNYVLAAMYIFIPYLWFINVNPITALLLILGFIAGILILCIPGKVSSQLPHNPVKRFNWGAFWGTWIWGLFNKTYVTLWSLILNFTPAVFVWSLICGLKGNEWAYKNTGADDMEAFHKRQKTQAVVWNSIAGFALIVLPILVAVLLAGFIATAAIKNPEGFEKVMNTANKVLETVVLDNFEDWELDIDENKFYMEPEVWIGLAYDERYNLFKGAATYASIEKIKKFEKYNSNRTAEMSKTKIYSTYNGEILAEFNVDMNEVKDFKSAFKSVLQGLYFNTSPELP